MSIRVESPISPRSADKLAIGAEKDPLFSSAPAFSTCQTQQGVVEYGTNFPTVFRDAIRPWEHTLLSLFCKIAFLACLFVLVPCVELFHFRQKRRQHEEKEEEKKSDFVGVNPICVLKGGENEVDLIKEKISY